MLNSSTYPHAYYALSNVAFFVVVVVDESAKTSFQLFKVFIHMFHSFANEQLYTYIHNTNSYTLTNRYITVFKFTGVFFSS